jgi:hypothetical protein
MKKIIGIVAFLLISSISFAQQSIPRLIQYGVRGGANFSTFIGKDAEVFKGIENGNYEANTTFNYGVHFGIYAEIPVSDYIYFRPELNVSKKGVSNVVKDVSRIGNPDATSELTVKYKFNYTYIDVPLLAEIALPSSTNWRFLIGVQPSYLIRAQKVLENEITSVDDYFGLQAQKFNISAVGGINYEFDFGLNTSIRAEYGLLPVFKPFDGEKIDIKSISIQVSVGYTFSQLFNYGRTHRKGMMGRRRR